MPALTRPPKCCGLNLAAAVAAHRWASEVMGLLDVTPNAEA